MKDNANATPAGHHERDGSIPDLKKRAEKIANRLSAPGDETSDVIFNLIHEVDTKQFAFEIQEEKLFRAQQALADSRKQFYNLFHLAPVGYVFLAANGIVAMTNQMAEHMLAGPGDSLLGTPFSEKILAEDHGLYLSCLKRADTSGVRQKCEVRFTGTGQVVVSVRVGVEAIKNEDGRLGEWRLALLDVTPDEVQCAPQESAASRAANDQHRTILESITDGFMALDATWRITYFNETGARMLGLERRDLIGRVLWELFPHATSSKFYSEYHRALETHTPLYFEEYYPEPLNQWIEVHCYPSTGGLSVYFRDITERKREEANQELLKAVLQALNSGGQLRSIISDVLRLIKESTGFHGAGLRLRQGDDFPYYEHDGFSQEFIHRENLLCAQSNGATRRDEQGRAILECTCGAVLAGRVDRAMPCFTGYGSFWSNDSEELLALPLAADPRVNSRNFCIHHGYRSVGLFPVRAGEQIIGLLQLADPRTGMFTPGLIAFFENLTQNFGLALHRAAAEEAQRESRHRLERAQQIAHLGSWELDLTRNKLKWSDEVYRIFGLPPQQSPATYDSFLGSVHPDDRAAVDAAYSASLRDNLDAYEIEHRVVRQSTGEIRFLHEKCEHIRDASGRIVGSVGMVLDITERRQAEEALRQLNETLEQRVQRRTADLDRSNRQLQQEIEKLDRAERILQRERQSLTNILHSMQDGVYIVGADYQVQYVNPAIEKLFGHVSGRKCHELFHDLEAPCAWCNKNLLGEEGYLQWEHHFAKVDKHFEILTTPFLNEDGTIARLYTLRDTTWRKESEKALGESEERYRTLVQTMNEGLVVLDEKDAWTFVNPRFCSSIGYSYDEIVGRPVREWLDEPNAKILDYELRKCRGGGQEPYEIAWTRQDGLQLYTQVSPRAVFDAEGGYKGSFAVLTDITERKRAEESLRKAMDEIKTLKERLEAENIYFQKELKMKRYSDHMIGQSNALKYLLYRAEQVAPTTATILMLGETGTGKGVLAAAIHQMSPRRERPLVTVNCAALPANLIESELFGRERGAYTGSDTRQVGRFEIADGSTILLDEISELPLELQAKLLRVIQHNEFERLGSSRTIKVNARIIAATNRNLEQEVREGRFREDLFYRLNVFPLTVPPLRSRKEDIPALVEFMTERFGRKLGKRVSAVSREAMQELQEYDWPGNIRELENVIERAVILCSGPILCLTDHLRSAPAVSSGMLKTMEEAEREQILKTLRQTRWRIDGPNGAAAILDLPPSTLRSKMHKLGIRRLEMLPTE